MTHQSEIKNQRDSRNDRTSFRNFAATPSAAGARERLSTGSGPRAQLQVMRAGELAWLQPPPLDQETFEVERTIIQSAYNYWGKSVEGVDPNKVLRKQQRLIDSWLSELRAVYMQVYQLCEQYMDPQDWAAISGDPQSVPAQDRRSIQHNLQLVLEFDAKDLNTEYLGNKMNLIQQMLVATDAAGVIDRAGLTQYAARALDPALAGQIIKPSGQVTQQEITEEQAACAQIVSGVEPPVYQSGQNAQLRLQVMQSVSQAQDYVNFLRQQPSGNGKVRPSRQKHAIPASAAAKRGYGEDWRASGPDRSAGSGRRTGAAPGTAMIDLCEHRAYLYGLDEHDPDDPDEVELVYRKLAEEQAENMTLAAEVVQFKKEIARLKELNHLMAYRERDKENEIVLLRGLLSRLANIG